jgi:hypothetical protein
MDIAPGTEVEVLYRNSMYDRRHLYASHMHIPEFYTYRGAVYPRQKWQGPQTLNLTTGDANWPWRELQDAQIITVRAGEQTLEPLRKEVSKDRVWEVSGSKGNTYTVTEVAGKRTCTCPGFQFRHSCKHTLEVK